MVKDYYELVKRTKNENVTKLFNIMVVGSDYMVENYVLSSGLINNTVILLNKIEKKEKNQRNSGI